MKKTHVIFPSVVLLVISAVTTLAYGTGNRSLTVRKNGFNPEEYIMTEADCQLFQERLPQWQERLLNRLCDEYAALLTGPYRGSEAFWEVKRLIRKDMKRLEATAEEASRIIADLLRKQVNTPEDLRDFSEGFQETVEYLMRE